MSREPSINEQVAQGLLDLLGHAGHSMRLAREWHRHVEGADAGHDERPADSPSAARRLVALLEEAARGEAAPEPPPSHPAPSDLSDLSDLSDSSSFETSPPETSPPSPVKPASAEVRPLLDSDRRWYLWRRALLRLPENETEDRQVLHWLRAELAKAESSS